MKAVKRQSTVALLVAALGLAGVVCLAANAASQTSNSALKSVSCPPECGFMCRSHDEQELIEIVKAHAQQKHNATLTDEQIRAMMKG